MKKEKRVRAEGSQGAVKTQSESPALIVPFGVVPCPREVEMARFLILETYERGEAKPIDEFSSEMMSLYECIRYNPGLTSESKAVGVFVKCSQNEGELEKFTRSVARRKLDGQSTGLEYWIECKLSGLETKPLRESWLILLEMEQVLRENVIHRDLWLGLSQILDARATMNRLRVWTNSN